MTFISDALNPPRLLYTLPLSQIDNPSRLLPLYLDLGLRQLPLKLGLRFLSSISRLLCHSFLNMKPSNPLRKGGEVSDPPDKNGERFFQRVIKRLGNVKAVTTDLHDEGTQMPDMLHDSQGGGSIVVGRHRDVLHHLVGDPAM
ncbi:hypothetical protein HS088_TW06G01175 [Tripterygium wilfordii]|uniref:Uncharacterized protein n=1 Tax=Tripterygium wilfordii TaxID=458696 RepID=A0A7J7DL15_TRIWF|nr:hypothetical protein HS088_TW06G01175 [Tripterygium wilfordii]